jgi:putative RNA 2'-phosphotransferase
VPHQKELQKVAKFLAYVLGRRPDEFGLIPDGEGFVRIKELLKAVHEEAQWRYLRWFHLNELSLTLPNPPIEIQNQSVRSVNRQNMPVPVPAGVMPKLLYTCIRRKSYPMVMERDLTPRQGLWITLSDDSEMTLRLGRRFDEEPIVLIVNTLQSSQAKVEFLRFGEALYLAANIPAGCFTGPPLPKERPEKNPSRQSTKPVNTLTPGSFFIDWADQKQQPHAGKSKSGKKEIGWKEERRRGQRKKTSDWL